MELEIATSRVERVDLGDKIAEVANKANKEKAEEKPQLKDPEKVINLSSWFKDDHVNPEGWLNLPPEIPLEEIKNYLDDLYKKTQPPTP